MREISSSNQQMIVSEDLPLLQRKTNRTPFRLIKYYCQAFSLNITSRYRIGHRTMTENGRTAFEYKNTTRFQYAKYYLTRRY